ncbi:DUF4380 domain-containing protein [Marinitenerispora sediminis]|uniref:DUF4380 domain-containing protein n=1 Tax=Marinitenerispora sediminis TaxID=1931232 RepID=A0A368TC73_9ACTN|nr:DUF4380 domain-containing protein [Marinitenerispora sediminis]RCV57975.1 hypothetical protein DEF28_00740 [Marinitenerispora sediminis]RCV62293.1 hypothetical protein DEF23_00030 [Marinitenerispora sediminis]RCV62576.1 hypothetical protein DEF24_00465 [Marinitenerispora sediminis]
MSTPAVIRRAGSGPRERVVLDNGVVRLTAAPGLGGRLLSVRHRGREHLYRNPRLLDDDLQPVAGVELGPVDGPMSAWNNVGGDKTWPAPQGWDGPGQWAGPPDPVLDSGPYTAEAASAPDGSATLTLTSRDDPRSGLRLRRRLTLEPGAAGYRLDLEAVNVSGTVRRWALWNVTQIDGAPAAADGAGGVYVGVRGPGPHTVPLVAGNGHPRVLAHPPSVVRVPPQDVVGKVGFPTASGWLANVGAAGTLTLRFDVSEGAEYPDTGSRAEVWLEAPVQRPLEHLGGLCPVDRVTEVEALGPLTELAPGQGMALVIGFGLGTGRDPVAEVTPDGFWSEPPRWGAREAGGRRLAGAFTASRPGALVHAASGRTVARTRPGEPARFDALVPAPGTGTAPAVVFVPEGP